MKLIEIYYSVYHRTVLLQHLEPFRTIKNFYKLLFFCEKPLTAFLKHFHKVSEAYLAIHTLFIARTILIFTKEIRHQ